MEARGGPGTLRGSIRPEPAPIAPRKAACMDEPAQEPERPPIDRPRYLPRLTYQEPEKPAEEPSPEPEPKPRSKKKKPDPAILEESPKPKKGVLIEETPDLDTFETRRKVRIAVGAAAGLSVALALFSVFRYLRSGDLPPEPPPVPVVAGYVGPPRPSPKQVEQQARQLLIDAREATKGGNPELALRRLRKIESAYPGSEAAGEARAARDRHAEGLPLFPDGPTVLAKKTAPRPEPEAPEVVAVAPAPSVAPGPVEVAVAPPPTPPEPYRETGLERPRADLAPRPLPAGFRPRAEAGLHPSGWPWEITCDQDGAAMVLVPGGTFTMGRDDGPNPERPAHPVHVSTFYIDQHEVTARQFALFKGQPPTDDNRPAVNVSHADARDYADWAGKAIPTEAQWELAARATDARLYPWGNAPPSWSRPRQSKQIDPVMSFPADLSPYGALDLAGNAWEWTADWFDPRYHEKLRARPRNDPTGPDRGLGRIPERTIKGGSKSWDVAWRGGMREAARLPYLGFRCVLQVERAEAPVPGTPTGPFPHSAPVGAPIPF